MQNVVVNYTGGMCEKFHTDRLRNDKSLGMENLITTRRTRTELVALGDPSSGLRV